jgi:DNA ligase-1
VPRFPSFVRVRKRADAPPASLPTPSHAAAARDRGTIGNRQGPDTLRRFEFVEGKSAKFWEISVVGNNVRVCFGRLGTSGQEKSTKCTDAAAAQKHADKLIEEKTGKGYVELPSQ